MEKSFFDKLLQKPESYRRGIAYIMTAVIGMFIFSGWLVLMSQSLRKVSMPDMPSDEQSSQDIRQKLPSLKDQETIKTHLMQQQEQAEDSDQLPARPTTPDDETQIDDEVIGR